MANIFVPGLGSIIGRRPVAGFIQLGLFLGPLILLLLAAVAGGSGVPPWVWILLGIFISFLLLPVWVWSLVVGILIVRESST